MTPESMIQNAVRIADAEPRTLQIQMPKRALRFNKQGQTQADVDLFAAIALSIHVLVRGRHTVKLILSDQGADPYLGNDGPTPLGATIPEAVTTIRGGTPWGFYDTPLMATDALHRLFNTHFMDDGDRRLRTAQYMVKFNFPSQEIRCGTCQEVFSDEELRHLRIRSTCAACEAARHDKILRQRDRLAIDDWHGPVMVEPDRYFEDLGEALGQLDDDGLLDAAKDRGFSVIAYPCITHALNPGEHEHQMLDPERTAHRLVDYFTEHLDEEYSTERGAASDNIKSTDTLHADITAVLKTWLEQQAYSVYFADETRVIWIHDHEATPE